MNAAYGLTPDEVARLWRTAAAADAGGRRRADLTAVEVKLIEKGTKYQNAIQLEHWMLYPNEPVRSKNNIGVI